MHSSGFARRRRQIGALVAGVCIAAGSVGATARADSGSGASIAIEAKVMVEAGMSPLAARQAAAQLNAAIDSAARNIAQSARSAIGAGRPVRTTADATRVFATRVDEALTQFAEETIGGLRTARTASKNLVSGTLTALNEVVSTVPTVLTVAVDAEVSVTSGADGTKVSASLNPVVDTAARQMIRQSVRAIRPVLPLTRTTVRTVAAGVGEVVEASCGAVNAVIEATTDFVTAVLGVTGTTVTAVETVAASAVAGINSIATAVDGALDNLADVNLTAAVDASLQVR